MRVCLALFLCTVCCCLLPTQPQVSGWQGARELHSDHGSVVVYRGMTDCFVRTGACLCVCTFLCGMTPWVLRCGHDSLPNQLSQVLVALLLHRHHLKRSLTNTLCGLNRHRTEEDSLHTHAQQGWAHGSPGCWSSMVVGETLA